MTGVATHLGFRTLRRTLFRFSLDRGYTVVVVVGIIAGFCIVVTDDLCA